VAARTEKQMGKWNEKRAGQVRRVGQVGQVGIFAVAFLTSGIGRGVPARAVPVEPIQAIVDAFASHSVVAISDGREHGDEEGQAFILSLVRDLGFLAAASDIVVECCNALYQERIDRFVQGGDVDANTLADLWRNSTQVNATQRDCPFCDQLFSAVRSVNRPLSRERKIRILLGDPPIDWDAVHTKDDHAKWIEQRDTYPADLVRREIVEKHRHALVVYGGMHLQRKQLLANYESNGLAETLISRLESTTGKRAFTIYAATKLEELQPDVASWRSPALALVGGTALGAVDFAEYYRHPVPRFAMRDGKPDLSTQVPRDQWRTLHMEDQFDAILYLGPTMTIRSRLSPDMCADTGYMKTLRARMVLAQLKPEIDRLNAYCSKLPVGG
jgi:hypothetical protein